MDLPIFWPWITAGKAASAAPAAETTETRGATLELKIGCKTPVIYYLQYIYIIDICIYIYNT
jgi:hypothetical protein